MISKSVSYNPQWYIKRVYFINIIIDTITINNIIIMNDAIMRDDRSQAYQFKYFFPIIP